MGLEQLAIALGFYVVKAMVDAGKIRADQTVADALAVLDAAKGERGAAEKDWGDLLPPTGPKNE